MSAVPDNRPENRAANLAAGPPPPRLVSSSVDDRPLHDPAAFRWERVPTPAHLDPGEHGTHRWLLRHPEVDGSVCVVSWDNRYGWDAYGCLTHGYIGAGSQGDGEAAEERAKRAALQHALCHPLADAAARG